MNVEQQNHAAPDWRPPSPNSTTPQSAGLMYPGYSYQSPTNSESSPSHFQNAWMTPQNKGYEAYSNMSNPWPSNTHHEDPYSNVAYGHVGNVQGPESGGMGFQDDPFVKPASQQPFVPSSMPLINVSPVQMRTPPPTRDSTTKRKPQQAQLQNLQTSAGIASRRMSSPSTAWLRRSIEFPSADASLSPFNNLPFVASDTMQFSFGPATAPVYQPSNLFWDPSSTTTFGTSQLSGIGDDPFSTQTTQTDASGVDTLHAGSTLQNLHPPPMAIGSSVKRQEIKRTQSARSVNTQARPRPSSFTLMSSTTSVNPSLLQATETSEFVASSQGKPSAPAIPANNRQPYEHQLEHARREKELDRSRRSYGPNSRPGTASSTGDASDVSFGLRRSLTDSRSKRSGEHSHNPSFISSAGIHDITQGLRDAHIPRTASPLKRHKSEAQKANSHIGPSTRRSIVLTVDEMGRARTEVKPLEPMLGSRVQESSMGCWDGSNGSSPEPEDVPASSQTSSSATIESSASQLEVGSRASRRAARSLMSDFNVETQPRPRMLDAQTALREVMKGRQNRRRATQTGQPTIRSEAHVRQPDQPRIRSTPDTARFAPDPGYNAWAEPSSAPNAAENHGAFPDDSIRCVCGSNYDTQQLMIQCESCTMWLHVSCLGLNADYLPPVYVCVHCTGQTPVVRGGRTRDPIRARHRLSTSFTQETDTYA